MNAKTYNILIFFAQGAFIAYDIKYFNHAGLPIALVALAATGFDLSSILAELPTSVLFDRLSNKWVLVFGNCVRIAGFLVFIAAPQNFACVLLGQILTGIGSATESGAASALYINESEKSAGFEAVLGALSEAIGLATVMGGVAGALAWRLDPRGIWVIAAIAYLAATLLLFVILRKGKPRGAVVGDEPRQRAFREVLGVVYRLPATWCLLCLNAAALSVFFLWQVHLGTSSEVVWSQLVGLLAMNVASAAAGRFGARLGLSKLGNTLAIVLLNAGVCAVFAVIVSPALALALFALHVFLQVAAINFVAGKLHEELRDNERATAFSLVSMGDAALAAILGPAIGYVADHTGLRAGLLFTVPLYGVAAVLLCRADVNWRQESWKTVR